MSEGIDQPHAREIDEARICNESVLKRARDRVRAVANGATIFATYSAHGPGYLEMYVAFRRDLQAILGEGSPPRD